MQLAGDLMITDLNKMQQGWQINDRPWSQNCQGSVVGAPGEDADQIPPRVIASGNPARIIRQIVDV